MVIAIIELFTAIFNGLDQTQKTFLHKLHREEICIRGLEISDMLRHVSGLERWGQLGFTCARASVIPRMEQ